MCIRDSTNPLPSLHPFDLLVGAACGALLWFIAVSYTHLVTVLPVKQSLAAVPWQQTDHALEQGGFTNAIWTKTRKDVTFFQTQIDIFENHRQLCIRDSPTTSRFRNKSIR